MKTDAAGAAGTGADADGSDVSVEEFEDSGSEGHHHYEPAAATEQAAAAMVAEPAIAKPATTPGHSTPTPPHQLGHTLTV